MFLKTGEVKKMMKAALKSAGLTVGLVNGRYIVNNEGAVSWAISVDEQMASKKFRAAIMELTGMLPEAGDCYDFTLDGKETCVQRAIFCSDAYSEWVDAKRKAVVTPLILNDITHEYTLCQEASGEYFLVNRDWLNAISPSELEAQEEMPGAPVCRFAGLLCRMYFKNEFMTYQVTGAGMPGKINDALIPALSGLNFFRQDWLPEPELEQDDEDSEEDDGEEDNEELLSY